MNRAFHGYPRQDERRPIRFPCATRVKCAAAIATEGEQSSAAGRNLEDVVRRRSFGRPCATVRRSQQLGRTVLVRPDQGKKTLFPSHQRIGQRDIRGHKLTAPQNRIAGSEHGGRADFADGEGAATPRDFPKRVGCVERLAHPVHAID